ncbi:MAG TPA: DNA repair protein RecO, partial [Thermoanaerobaculia bacterium]|nr:DNA repair protein RecO [Thermoanaerobaculia bacterium]
MRFASAVAILLDVFDLHDRDRVVSFLTVEQGRVRGVASGAKRKHSRFAGQLQPLAKVKVTWLDKQGRDLVRITDVELVRPADFLCRSLEEILLGSYLADSMSHFAQENEEAPTAFRLLDSTLEALREGADLNLAARYYETWVLRLAGIFPPPRECPLCGNPFEPGEAASLAPTGDALICRRCAATEGPGMLVSPAALEFL